MDIAVCRLNNGLKSQDVDFCTKDRGIFFFYPRVRGFICWSVLKNIQLRLKTMLLILKVFSHNPKYWRNVKFDPMRTLVGRSENNVMIFHLEGNMNIVVKSYCNAFDSFRHFSKKKKKRTNKKQVVNLVAVANKKPGDHHYCPIVVSYDEIWFLKFKIIFLANTLTHRQATSLVWELTPCSFMWYAYHLAVLDTLWVI